MIFPGQCSVCAPDDVFWKGGQEILVYERLIRGLAPVDATNAISTLTAATTTNSDSLVIGGTGECCGTGAGDGGEGGGGVGAAAAAVAGVVFGWCWWGWC